MTRFQKEISGVLGPYWVESAMKELEKEQSKFNKGEITVDEKGVLRNSIGRVATSEICEKCKYIGVAFNENETETARENETSSEIAKYKASQKNRKISEEEIIEMRSAFGENTTVVDVLTGKRIKL